MARKAKPATTSNATKLEKAIGVNKNTRPLRAMIIKAKGEEESRQTTTYDRLHSIKGIIDPPYPLINLEILKENSSELGQVIDAMVMNIDGFGYRLMSHNIEESLSDEEKKEALSEKSKIKTFLDNISWDMDITKLRKETRMDLELTGNAYWELIPFARRDGLSSIERMEPHNVRLIKRDNEFTEVNMKFYNEFTKEIESKVIKKRFRKYVQECGESVVFFKEWGDPRTMDNTTGEYLTDDEVKKLPASRIANPLIHFKLFSNRTPYGLPRYIGNLFSIHGSRSSEEINYNTFENNNIPSMIISVSNGQLTEGSVQRIEEFIETKIKASSNRSSVLIIEAEPADEDQINPGTMKIDIKDVSGAQKEDQLFQNYDKNNCDKIRRAYRLPPMFVGKAEDYNRSTAEESKKVADEQIFSPEREDFDKSMNRLLVHYFGMKYHKFVSNSQNVTNDENLVKVISGAEKTGGVTPNLARRILSMILNMELPDYDENKVDFDPNIPMSLTLVERAKNVAGNSNSGTLAPNQGQLSTKALEELDNDALVEIEKQLINTIYNELGIINDRQKD